MTRSIYFATLVFGTALIAAVSDAELQSAIGSDIQSLKDKNVKYNVSSKLGEDVATTKQETAQTQKKEVKDNSVDYSDARLLMHYIDVPTKVIPTMEKVQRGSFFGESNQSVVALKVQQQNMSAEKNSSSLTQAKTLFFVGFCVNDKKDIEVVSTAKYYMDTICTLKDSQGNIHQGRLYGELKSDSSSYSLTYNPSSFKEISKTYRVDANSSIVTTEDRVSSNIANVVNTFAIDKLIYTTTINVAQEAKKSTAAYLKDSSEARKSIQSTVNTVGLSSQMITGQTIQPPSKTDAIAAFAINSVGDVIEAVAGPLKENLPSMYTIYKDSRFYVEFDARVKE